MSGIVGLINLDGAPVDRERLRQLTDALAYRGPDRQAVWCDGPTGFGHTLLATTFEARRERQPCSLDGQVWITADARIDGRDELKAKLRGKVSGELRDATDVELILHAYAAWGEDCVRHLLGDFVFAIRDGRENRLFCARDHFGVKCLFHARVGDTLLIGNDLDVLRRHPGLSDELDELFIADFLLFGHSQEPDASVYRAIRRLPPAHTLSVAPGGKPVIRRYWDLALPEEIRYRRDEEYIEHFLDVFRPAVADRLRTDRVAISMSGGMDSSSVAAMAKEIVSHGRQPARLHAFTFVFDRLFHDDERHYAGLVAEHLDIPIRFLPADDFRLLEGWDDPQLRPPEPDLWDLCPGSLTATYRSGIEAARVVLTGFGGDPAFAFERSYLLDRLRAGRLPALLRETTRHYRLTGRLPPLGLKWRWQQLRGQTPVRPFPDWLDTDFTSRLNLRERYFRLRLPPHSADRGRENARHSLIAPFWPRLFASQQQISGAEPRHPFFDLRLLSGLLAIPGTPWIIGKRLLRQSMRNHLPIAICQRPKTPLRDFPHALYMTVSHDWRDAATQLLDTPSLQPIIRTEKLTPVVQQPEILDPQSRQFRLSSPLRLAMWCQTGQNCT